MHELSVCQSIVAQLEGLAAAHGSSRVSRIEVAVGPLSGVEPDLLARAFPIAAAGGIADGARLSISIPAIAVRCTGCGAISEVAANHLVCSACGDFRTRLVSGDELLLERVEFEQVQPGTAAPAEETEHV